jgi:16S rRNA G527 N7-methylase RsmG
VEIRERRVHFLRHVVRTLGLGCRVERREIERAPETPVDRALLRAVAPPDRALELATPWVAPGGEVWIWTGPGAPRPEGARVIPLSSGGQIHRIPV